jgi:hypothetical protein
MEYATQSLSALKVLAAEINATPIGDKRSKQAWIDAIQLAQAFAPAQMPSEAQMESIAHTADPSTPIVCVYPKLNAYALSKLEQEILREKQDNPGMGTWEACERVASCYPVSIDALLLRKAVNYSGYGTYYSQWELQDTHPLCQIDFLDQNLAKELNTEARDKVLETRIEASYLESIAQKSTVDTAMDVWIAENNDNDVSMADYGPDDCSDDDTWEDADLLSHAEQEAIACADEIEQAEPSLKPAKTHAAIVIIAIVGLLLWTTSMTVLIVLRAVKYAVATIRSLPLKQLPDLITNIKWWKHDRSTQQANSAAGMLATQIAPTL